MRALLIAVGSRGDAEPFVSLARSLGQRHHHVDLFLQKDLIQLSEPLVTTDASIKTHELPFTQTDFYKYVGTPTHGSDNENPRVRFVGVVTDVIAELVLPCTASVLQIAAAPSADSEGKTSSVIVTSSLARPLALLVARKLDNIPVCAVNLQPLVPTRRFPHYSQTETFVQRILDIVKGSKSDVDTTTESDNGADDKTEFEQSYWELEEYHHSFLQERLDNVYAQYDLPPLPFDDTFRNGIVGRDGGRTIVANAFSTELIPSAADDSTTVFDIGALADAYIPSDWTPPDDLLAFLQAPGDGKDNEKPPICIGFGSMPFAKAAMVVDALQSDCVGDDGLSLQGRKAILVGSVFVQFLEERQKERAEEQQQQQQKPPKDRQLMAIPSAPYAWLLPRCSVMVSHGGAGVVHAALRAGIPNAVAPLIGDQFVHAKLLEARQLGAQVCAHMDDLTPDNLVRAILAAEDAACLENARRVGERIRSSPTGVDKLIQVLEERIA